MLAEDGGLWMFGYGGQGQLGTGSKENAYGPKRVSLPSSSARPVEVICGVEYTVVLAREDSGDGSSRGVMFGSGENGCGQLGLGHSDIALSFERAALGGHDIVGAMCSKALTVIRTRNPAGLWCLGDVAPPLFQVNLDTPSGTTSAAGGGSTPVARSGSQDGTSSPRMSVSARVLNVVNEPRALEPVPVALLPAGAADDAAGTPLPEQAGVVLAAHASPHQHMLFAVQVGCTPYLPFSLSLSLSSQGHGLYSHRQLRHRQQRLNPPLPTHQRQRAPSQTDRHREAQREAQRETERSSDMARRTS